MSETLEYFGFDDKSHSNLDGLVTVGDIVGVYIYVSLFESVEHVLWVLLTEAEKRLDLTISDVEHVGSR